MKKCLLICLVGVVMGVLQGQQAVLVLGTVTDSLSGEALIGASVLAGEGRGTITDLSGKFSSLLKAFTTSDSLTKSVQKCTGLDL